MESRLKDRYELKESLGHGGMGVVRQAYDTVLRCDVAVKLIRDIPEPASLQLFYRECETLASLNHPNIVQILDQGEFDEDGLVKPYFVMPLLPGATLDKMLGSGPLGIERTLDILTQVCRGLGAAHQANVVHRDLKPSNIFVMRDDSVEIIDFGISHMTNKMTTKGRKGTLAYMSPELLEMKQPSALSDIYSLGVVAYQMLTGRQPFDRATENELIYAILHEAPAPILELNPNLNQTVARVIHKAMAKQPWHRFSSAREFSECLQKAHRGETIEYFEMSGIEPRIERVRKACSDGDFQLASEVLGGLEAEGQIHPAMRDLRHEIDQHLKRARIEHLLELAQARLEVDEGPLALQRIEEALVLDPGNRRALELKASIEKVAVERKVAEWLKLANQHLANRAFGPAREAVRNLQALNAADTDAARLSGEIDAKEQESIRLRSERMELHEAAAKLYKQGDLDAALVKLERAVEIDRAAPASSSGNTGGLQALYREIRAEAERLRAAHEEAFGLLQKGDLAAAWEACEGITAKYPDNPAFKALRLDINQKLQVQRSAFIAETNGRIDAEADLQRKLAIIEEALVRFPGEEHFERAAKLLRERLNLAKSIEHRARQFEGSEQFDEAIAQWQTLDAVYPNFPGLAAGIARLRQRREEQKRGSSRARIVEQIERLEAAGQFEKAIEASRTGLHDFPGDPELLQMEKTAQMGVERLRRAGNLAETAETHFGRGEFEQGVAVLKQALELDPANAKIRSTLVDRLNERARTLLETDPDGAERLIVQILFFDSMNAAASSLRLRIQDRRQERRLSSAVSKILEAQASGDHTSVRSQLAAALQAFPGEPRLVRLQRQQDLEEIQRLGAGAALAPNVSEAGRKLDAMRAIALRYPGDRDFISALEKAETSAKLMNSPPAADDVKVPGPPAMPPPPPPEAVSGPPVSPTVRSSATQLLSRSGIARASAKPPAPPVPQVPNAPEPANRVTENKPPASPAPSATGEPPKWKSLQQRERLLIAVAVLLMLLAAGVFAIRRARMGRSTASTQVVFRFQSNVPGAEVWRGSQRLGTTDDDLSLTSGAYELSIQKLGFESETIVINLQAGKPAGPLSVQLHPRRPVLNIDSPFMSGSVLLDDKQIATLGSTGLFQTPPIEDGNHQLKIQSNSSTVSMAFSVQAGTLATLAQPTAPAGLEAIAIYSLRDQAVVSSTLEDMSSQLDAMPAARLKSGGISFDHLTGGSHALVLGSAQPRQWSDSINSGPEPQFVLHIVSMADLGTLFVDVTGATDAHIFVDGVDRGPAPAKGSFKSSLNAGNHTVTAQRDGYMPDPALANISIGKGGVKRVNFTLAEIPKPVQQPTPQPAPAPAPPPAPVKQIGRVHVEFTPANAEVSYTHDGEVTRVSSGSNIELDPGQYIFSAQAAGFVPDRQPVDVRANTVTQVAFNLTAAKPEPKSAISHPMNRADWDQPLEENGVWYTRGNNTKSDLVLYKVTPISGSVEFRVQPKGAGFLNVGRLIGAGSKIHCVISYRDAKNYTELEIDHQSYRRSEFVGGSAPHKPFDKKHGLSGDSIHLKIYIDPSRVRVVGVSDDNNEHDLDEWNTSGVDPTQGRFGFRFDSLRFTDFVYMQNP